MRRISGREWLDGVFNQHFSTLHKKRKTQIDSSVQFLCFKLELTQYEQREITI